MHVLLNDLSILWSKPILLVCRYKVKSSNYWDANMKGTIVTLSKYIKTLPLKEPLLSGLDVASLGALWREMKLWGHSPLAPFPALSNMLLGRNMAGSPKQSELGWLCCWNVTESVGDACTAVCMKEPAFHRPGGQDTSGISPLPGATCIWTKPSCLLWTRGPPQGEPPMPWTRDQLWNSVGLVLKLLCPPLYQWTSA